MPDLPDNSNVADPSSPLLLPAAFLALRDRARGLLRDRSRQLHQLESRLHEQLSQLVAELGETAEVDSPRQRIQSLEDEVHHLQQLRLDSERALNEARLMLAEMEDERRALRDRQDAADSQPDPSPAPEKEELTRLQRRLELAMQEIRELKQQNQELSSHSPPRATPGRASAAPLGNSFDWESQKLRLLQELESNFDSSTPERAEEKLAIEEVIRETDRIVAEKDRELAALRQQLAEVSAGHANQAVDKAAQDKLLDADQLIATERTRLQQLQEEWREKLRQSEVEISIERAKLARERLQLEERSRFGPAPTPPSDSEEKKGDDSKLATAQRGRWLTRLGLSNSE
jgi:hypothetical protein